ncbi:hypothetical protein RKD35_006766 [Streptomyces albogriseolus]
MGAVLQREDHSEYCFTDKGPALSSSKRVTLVK